MRSNCEQFADRGDAMDARVRPDIGLSHEPSRLRDDWFAWDQLAPEPRYRRPPTPVERPDPVQVRASAEARRQFNRAYARNRVRLVL